MSGFKDAGHLFRFAGLFVLAFLVFLVVRHYVVPKTFGQYGHYRGAAIGEIAARPVKFAGHQTCETCHADILDVKTNGKHAHVNCEACHGALANHADDPTDHAGAARHGGAVRPLSHGQRSQAQGLSAGCAGRSLGRGSLRDLPQAAQPGHGCRRCEMKISRRQMLILLPAAAVAWESVLAGTPEASPNYKMTEHWWGMLIDIPKCIGCGNCVGPARRRTMCRTASSAPG